MHPNLRRSSTRPGRAALVSVVSLWLVGCGGGPAPATSDEAEALLSDANATILKLGTEAAQAGWVYSTYITSDTEALNARATQVFLEAVKRLAREAARFDGVDVPPDARRQLDLLKLGLELVPPSEPALSEEVTTILSRMEGAYGRGQWCEDPAREGACFDIERITEIMATSRDPERLRAVWEGWHTISVPMREDYERFVALANTGARELGFADTGAMWRLKYDMPADDFTAELDRLWEQVRPLYASLHTYVRMKLRQRYGDVVPADGPIPAHLLGNIWAQDWRNVFDLVASGTADPGFSLTDILGRRRVTATEMVRIGERFYTSLGLAPLPDTFWQRSLFVKPADRDVVCHASAWNVDSVDDLRIKMCIDPTEEDFITIHHELGHSYYQRAYNRLPALFRDSANQAFHEAIGDTIALSVTPEYLVRIGLLDRAPDASRDIGLLLSRAMQKVAFLPFGLLIDQWRWQVFSGEVPPAGYNAAWWDLRLKYQGVAPIAPRGEEFFDPGAKYHVPANYSYTRYFLAHILQFQFHRELAKIAGCETPLHRCSIYESAEAGRRLNAMLELGAAQPWPDALEALTGSHQMDATAIVDYFAPLKAWLDEQTRGETSGW
ncbi:MAG TPA: M2 family metallopeptidase [Vicinamibacterales bacterium]|nr:M2 family metallopeptidase [Vicinamibacterales bacterium]